VEVDALGSDPRSPQALGQRDRNQLRSTARARSKGLRNSVTGASAGASTVVSASRSVLAPLAPVACGGKRQPHVEAHSDGTLNTRDFGSEASI
jgi:hypothetical protein